jgi:hypothetical protein
MLQYATACIIQKPMIKPQIMSPAPHEHLSFAATYCKLNLSRICTCKYSGFTLTLQSREKRTHYGSVQSNAALLQQNFAFKLQGISKTSLQLKPSKEIVTLFPKSVGFEDFTVKVLGVVAVPIKMSCTRFGF